MKIAVIPARYNSSRFPGKPLVSIFGKPMIQHVYENVKKTNLLNDVLIGTDDKRIKQSCVNFGAKVVLTKQNHLNGTSRCLEAVLATYPNIKDDDIILNIQGDEPFIQQRHIEKILACFEQKKTKIATLKKKIYNQSEVVSKHVVKVCTKNKQAETFYRINKGIEIKEHFKHIGLYGFKFQILKQVCKMLPTANEKKLKLEQIRWLENGIPIKVAETTLESFSIDTPKDLKKIIDKLQRGYKKT